jgi:hypothetical protein
MSIGTSRIARAARRAALFAALFAALPFAAHAQKTFIGITGEVFRYHGDTIWMNQDSTEQRSITHGDTISTRMLVNDQLVRETVAVVHGDSARVLSTTGRTGVARPASPTTKAMPADALTFLQKTLEMEMRAASMSPAFMMDRFTLPTLPDTAREYAISPASRIVQHRDTVRLIKGCPAEHNDTTTFLMFGADSARRLNAPSRTFGQGMAQTLIGQMRNSMLQSMVASMAPAPPPDLPKAIPTCGHQ